MVSGEALRSAARKLSVVTYPFIKDVDWTSDLLSTPIPGKSLQEVMQEGGQAGMHMS